MIGIGLVCFLVNELDTSVRAAIFGTWKWKRAIQSLHKSISHRSAAETRCYDHDSLRSLEEGSAMSFSETQSALFAMFDEIYKDNNGQIDPDELLDAMLDTSVNIDARGVRVLIQTADANGDGMINKAEWLTVIQKI